MKKTTDTPAPDATTNGAKRTRRSPSQLFTDAIKERKDEITYLEAKLEKAKASYAEFVQQAKIAMEL